MKIVSAYGNMRQDCVRGSGRERLKTGRNHSHISSGEHFQSALRCVSIYSAAETITGPSRGLGGHNARGMAVRRVTLSVFVNSFGEYLLSVQNRALELQGCGINNDLAVVITAGARKAELYLVVRSHDRTIEAH